MNDGMANSVDFAENNGGGVKKSEKIPKLCGRHMWKPPKASHRALSVSHTGMARYDVLTEVAQK